LFEDGGDEDVWSKTDLPVYGKRGACAAVCQARTGSLTKLVL